MQKKAQIPPISQLLGVSSELLGFCF